MPWAAAIPAILSVIGTAASTASGAMGGKGGGGNVDYSSSPEQQQMFQYLFPIAQMLGMYSEHMAMTPEGQFRPHLGAPMMGNAPVAAPKMPAGPGMYQIPSTKNLLPTQNWWENLSPEIKAGLYAPYEKSADILQERLGGLGQLGSARPGGSGAAGAAMGELYSQASKDVPLSAFQLSQPGYMTEFNALLNRNIAGYGTELERWRQNYGANMADYQTALIPWQQNYQTALQAWQFPYQALGSGAALSSALPTGIVSPRGNVAAGALGGLGTGLMAFGPGMGGGKGGGSSLPYTNTGAFSSPGMIARY